MEIIKIEDVESKIIIIRNEKVIIDRDVAELYGVDTKHLNRDVKNNPDKFPNGYIFELTKSEKDELVKNFHQFELLKHSSTNPKAFTEKGLYMLATILKSKKATQTTISIIETFTKVKNFTQNLNELINIDEESTKKSLIKKSGELFAEIIDDNLHIEQSETTIELNFAVLKLKHTIKRK